MTQLFHSGDLESLAVHSGETFQLESLRESVIPPYLMLMPFIELPENVKLMGQTALQEDGVHGCVYNLLPESAGKGAIVIGFRDIQSGKVTHRKEIEIIIN